MVIGSSLAGHSREMRDATMVEQASAASIGDKMAHAQKVATELEGKVAELKAW